MSDKFPPKNSGFRLETFRFPSDVTPCRHAIYHHGCPSCDERDPEGDDNDLVVGAPTREDGDSPTGAGYTPTTDFVLAAAEKVMDPILTEVRWLDTREPPAVPYQPEVSP